MLAKWEIATSKALWRKVWELTEERSMEIFFKPTCHLSQLPKKHRDRNQQSLDRRDWSKLQKVPTLQRRDKRVWFPNLLAPTSFQEQQFGLRLSTLSASGWMRTSPASTPTCPTTTWTWRRGRSCSSRRSRRATWPTTAPSTTSTSPPTTGCSWPGSWRSSWFQAEEQLLKHNMVCMLLRL